MDRTSQEPGHYDDYHDRGGTGLRPVRDSQEGWATTSACLYGITRKRISPRVLEGTHLERLRRARALVGDRDRRRDQLRVDDTPLGARALGAGAEREVAGLCARVEPGTEPDRFT